MEKLMKPFSVSIYSTTHFCRIGVVEKWSECLENEMCWSFKVYIVGPLIYSSDVINNQNHFAFNSNWILTKILFAVDFEIDYTVSHQLDSFLINWNHK